MLYYLGDKKIFDKFFWKLIKMKNKRMGLIITFVLVMFVASVAIGSVTAEDAKEVTIGKEKFKIPSGFEEKESKELSGGTIVKDYENGAKTIKLNVNSGDYKISKVKLEDGEVEKEIEGKKGAYAEGKTKFTYVSEDQKTTITVQCDSDDTLHEFLKLN